MQELQLIQAENHNSAYLDARLFYDDNVVPIGSGVKGVQKYGTRYSLNKDYVIENKKRIFNKKSVIYTSEYSIDEEVTDFDGEEAGSQHKSQMIGAQPIWRNIIHFHQRLQAFVISLLDTLQPFLHQNAILIF